MSTTSGEENVLTHTPEAGLQTTPIMGESVSGDGASDTTTHYHGLANDDDDDYIPTENDEDVEEEDDDDDDEYGGQYEDEEDDSDGGGSRIHFQAFPGYGLALADDDALEADGEDEQQFAITVGIGTEENSNQGDDDQLEEADDGVAPTAGRASRITVSRRELLQLLRPLGNRVLGRMFMNRPPHAGDEEDEDSLDDGLSVATPGGATRRTRGGETSGSTLPLKRPSDKGVELMHSGGFGLTDSEFSTRERKRRKGFATRLLRRELGYDEGPASRDLIKQVMIPDTRADQIIEYPAPCYSGQFSDDGDFFFSCGRDFKVRMYDTSNPYLWKHYKTVHYPFGGWTITDASLSPDNKFLAYSSIKRKVCLASTDPNEASEPYILDFVNPGVLNSWADIGIWSIRFSGDGRELVAGTNDNSVYVYDIESRQSILRIPGHKDHVNAVCYGDTTSPHILYSGSDDTTLKVWDRRSMGDSREAGVFIGHTEGITYVDSKGDGRYVLSNSKDQTMKLWDLRKMMSTERAAKIDTDSYSTGFDYRYMGYHDANRKAHPFDCSLVTFEGHRVLKTLIRCHFSPPGSSDSRYVYTGSADGKVYVYNLDGTQAATINVRKATKQSMGSEPRPLRAAYVGYGGGGGSWKTCVRDASWHPNIPMIAATSWNGWSMSAGTCTVHTWSDGANEDLVDDEIRVNEKLVPLQEPSCERSGADRVPGGLLLRRRMARQATGPFSQAVPPPSTSE